MAIRDGIARKTGQSPAHAPTERRLALPPLENGDRLTRREFERRYEARPDLRKAELIEGEVHVPSPVSASHSRLHGLIMGWLAVYCAATPGVQLHDNVTLRLDGDNVIQPDALLRLEPAAGGRSQITPDDYIEGAPELIVEIAASSAAYDLHDKLKVYRRNGVREYLVWQIFERRIDWFALNESEFVSLSTDDAGVFRSQVFPGVWLATPAMLNENLSQALADLQRGLETNEHTDFVKHLASAASP
jgi:Uma2 family endonuclease